MAKQLEDRSFKRLTDKFPVPMLKYLRVKHETVNPYNTKIELEDDTRQFLDYVIQIFEDKLFDLEFHSTVLTLIHLGRYGTYKIYLRMDSGKFVYQCILCTSDPKLSKRQLCINEDEELKMNIVFTQEDDADEKIKIVEEAINNNRKLTSTDIEIIYLTVALYMKSNLPKSELLFKIADLTNHVEGLSDDELYEIKLFQKAFMKKFISDDDELKGELEKMISIKDVEVMREIFPEESEHYRLEAKEEGWKEGREEGRLEGREEGRLEGREEGILDGVINTARNMKKFDLDMTLISNVTGLSIEEIEKL